MWQFVPCSGCLSIIKGRVPVIDVTCMAVQVSDEKTGGQRLAARSEEEQVGRVYIL